MMVTDYLIENCQGSLKSIEVSAQSLLTVINDTLKYVTIHFEVEDSGIGIPAGRMKPLFVPFEQMDSSTTRRFGGTGLGLTISKQLVDLMGGAIGGTREVGVGSKFWFTLDFQKQKFPCENRLNLPEGLKGLNFLFVTDDKGQK